MATAAPPPKKKSRAAGKLVQGEVVAEDREARPDVPGFNLAGRPDSLKKKDEGGLKKTEVKAVGPYHTSNLNTETYWHFVIRSSKNEWIRFKPDSLSFVLYGTVTNPNHDPAGANAMLRAERHALRAGEGNPDMFLDPSVLGSGFIDRVDVSINNVPVPTNSTVGQLFLQYVRCARVFTAKPGPLLSKTTDIAWANPQNRARLSKAMQRATEPFDYHEWDAAVGQRVPVYLDGVFPFDFRNQTVESIDRRKEPNLFFPPDTEFDIKFHTRPDKIESVFHDNVTVQAYFGVDPVDAAERDLKLTIQDVALEYESAELKASEHVKALKQYMDGGVGIYDYDIVRGQNQALTAGASYTQTTFQIMPQARLAYVLFLSDHATFTQTAKRMPVSGLSRFPDNLAELRIEFGGEPNLVTPKLVNFGKRAENHHISMKIFYDYLVERRITSLPFDDFFPRAAGVQSLVQCLVLDLKDHMSDRTELLNLKATYTGGTSPAQQQVVCLSVHPNGRATCRSSGTQFEWIWSFSQLS
jgi:hypothetical protein